MRFARDGGLQMSEMKIKIHEIGPDGRSLSLPFSKDWAARVLSGVDAELVEPAGADLRLERVGDDILLRGRMLGHVNVPCGRCLAPARIDLAAPVQMTYTQRPEVVSATVEIADDDVDFATFDGYEIDLGELFREQILLAIPMVPLCAPDCKGLCAQCGKDLNQGPCGCTQHNDERWNALRGLKV
jgi:uncharacterized protein